MAIDRPLIEIRERPLIDVLDLGFVVARGRPKALLLAALAGIVPFAALNAWIFRASDDIPGVAVLLLLAFEAPLATAPLTVALGALMFGQRPTFGRVASTVLRSAGPLLIYQGLLRTALLCTFPLSLLVPTHLAFQGEVILLERGLWWKVIRRSSNLCAGRRGELVLLAMLQLGYGAAFAAAVWVGGGSLFRTLVGEDPTWETPEGADLADLRFQLAFWMAAAFFAVARFLLYIDQRIRLEGWEVELRLRALGRSLEEERRW